MQGVRWARASLPSEREYFTGLADRITLIRTMLGYSVTRLSAESGIERRSIQKWHHGQRPTLYQLEIVARVFGMTLVDFLTYPVPSAGSREGDAERVGFA